MSHPVLGYDPAPGDPAAVRLLAQTFGSAAEDAESITDRLRRIGPGAGDTVWRGPAAESFHTLLSEVGPDVIRLASAHREAQDALVHYAAELERAQDIGRRAESDAARATGERDRAAQQRQQAGQEAAERDRESWACRARIAESQAQRLLWVADPAYQAELQRYETQVRARQQQAEGQAAQARGRERSARTAESTAAAHLRAAEILGEQAREVRDTAARHTVDRLDRAGQQGQMRRGIVERLLTAADDLGRKIVTSPGFDRLLRFVDGAGAAMTVLGAIALFVPGLQPVGLALLAGAGIASWASLIGTAGGVRYGTRNSADLAWSILGVIPGVKVAKHAGHGVSALLRGRLGTVKRAIFYADARRATILRNGVPVAPKIRTLAVLDRRLPIVPQMFYAARLGIEAVNFGKAIFDTVHNARDLGHRLVRPLPPVPPPSPPDCRPAPVLALRTAVTA